MTTQTKNRGFTLVELLIVIVIIAILTVVSLVAYNGLQDQAKTSTAKSTQDSIAKKAELYNTEEGKYPTSIAALTGGSSASADLKKKSYYIDAANVEVASAAITAAPAQPITVYYVPCPASGDATGASIFVWDYSKKEQVERKIGTC